MEVRIIKVVPSNTSPKLFENINAEILAWFKN